MTMTISTQWTSKPGWTFRTDGTLTNVCGVGGCRNPARLSWCGTNLRVCDGCVRQVEIHPESVDWALADDGTALFMCEPEDAGSGVPVSVVMAPDNPYPVALVSPTDEREWSVELGEGWSHIKGMHELNRSVYSEPTAALFALQGRYAGHQEALRRYHGLKRILFQNERARVRHAIPDPVPRSTALVTHQMSMATLCRTVAAQFEALTELFAMTPYCRLPMSVPVEGLVNSAERWRRTSDYLTQWMERCYRPYAHPDNCAQCCAA